MIVLFLNLCTVLEVCDFKNVMQRVSGSMPNIPEDGAFFSLVFCQDPALHVLCMYLPSFLPARHAGADVFAFCCTFALSRQLCAMGDFTIIGEAGG